MLCVVFGWVFCVSSFFLLMLVAGWLRLALGFRVGIFAFTWVFDVKARISCILWLCLNFCFVAVSSGWNCGIFDWWRVDII